MLKLIARYFIIVLFAIAILSFIWMDCTHTIRDGNHNYSPESFSFSYSHPLLWFIPIISLGMFFLPLYWRTAYATHDNAYKYSIFPCGESLFSNILGAILSCYVIFVALCAVGATIVVGLSRTWYMEEDLGLMLFAYIFFGIIAFVTNLSYGMFSPKNYYK